MYSLTARSKELESVAPSLATADAALQKRPIAQTLELCRAETGKATKPTFAIPKP